MMTVQEAADNLFQKGIISKEECDGIKKEAASGIPAAIKDIAQPAAYGALGLGLLYQMLKPLVQRVQSNIAFNKITEKVPALKEKDPETIKDYFNVVRTFSPKAATNPLVAGALVNKMMEFGGVDHKLVQDISAIQSGINNFSPIQDLSGAAAKNLLSGGDGSKDINVHLMAE